MASEPSSGDPIEVESRIVRLARRFLAVTPADFDACVEEGLEQAAALCAADRVQLFVMNPGATGVGGYYQWCAEGVVPRDPGDLSESTRRFRWSSRRLLRGEVLHVGRLSELPPEASPERVSLARNGARSYLAIPLVHEKQAVGFLDFFRNREERGWSEREIARLQLVGDVFLAAVRRLHAEEEREAAQERFRALAQHASDSICEMSVEGRVLWVSPSWERISGFSPEDVAAMEDPWSRVHPEDVRDVRRSGALLLSGADPGPIRYRYLHRDGSWLWLESTLSLFDTSGTGPRMAIVSRDVTASQLQRFDLERKLDIEARVADFSRALLEQGASRIDDGIQHGLEAAAGIAGAERSYLVTSLVGDDSAATCYDWHAEGVAPRTNKMGMTDRRQQRWLAVQLARGEIVRVPRARELPEEARAVRETLIEGGIRSLLCIPINAEGRLVGVLGFHCLERENDWGARELAILRLVADLLALALRRKRTEVALVESQGRLLQSQKMEAVGTLAGGIAHDFNNQLTVMLANARYALREVGTHGELGRALGDLHRAAEHCVQLTRALLAFSRRTPASPVSLDVRHVAAQVEELLRPLIPSSIAFEVVCGAGDVRVSADPIQLQQVLVNLVVNARDAMPDGGRLSLLTSTRPVEVDAARRLGLSGPGSYVEFRVEDTGIGMDEEVRVRIFEPFFTTKPVGRGTGLGLATAYGIVQECGGTIVVESEPGRGSCFQVLLPESLESAPERAAETAALAPRGSGTVLVAEDEAGVRRLVVRILREAGYEVIEARDGLEALELAAAGAIDALVTDVVMPRLDGVELSRRLARESPALPVLLIGGGGPDPLRDGHTPGGRSRFLAKPFGDGELLDALRALLEG